MSRQNEMNRTNEPKTEASKTDSRNTESGKTESIKTEPGKMESTEKMYKMACPECSFTVQSQDESEVVSKIQQHATKMHNKNMTESEIKTKMQAMA